jgi:hypothetical protein
MSNEQSSTDKVPDETVIKLEEQPASEPTKVDAPSSTSLATMGTGLSELFGAIVHLSEGGTYHEPTCPVCNSKHRTKAEEAWRSMDIGTVRDRAARVKQYLTSVGETISADAIRNHAKAHMEAGEVELRKIEYLTKVSNLSNVGITTVEQVNMGMAVIWECIVASGAIVGDGKSLSNAKATEIRAAIISKLTRAWTDMLEVKCKMLGQMKDKGEVISIPLKSFSDLMNRTLIKAETKAEKDLVGEIMDGIRAMAQ